jgi:outer membrane biosynthesis protein TonB
MDRLRWDNIARAAAVLAVVALVVAWPHLRGAPPPLPSAAATPVSVEDPALPAAPERRVSEPAPVAHRPKPRPKPRHRRKPSRQRHHAQARVRSAPAAPAAPPVASPPPAPSPAPAPSADDIAAHEFAVP